MKYITRKFDSLHQYVSYLNKAETSKLFKTSPRLSSLAGTQKFTGTASYEEAGNLLQFGDRENLAKLNRIAVNHNLKGTGERVKTETYRSFVGYAPHVPSYISGQPKTMLRKKQVKTQNSKVLNIMYSPIANCMATCEDRINTSIKVMSFISSLEKQGYRINLYTLISAYEGKECISQIVKIKSSDDYTDLAKMVYPMVNPSFQRRHNFRFIEVDPDITERGFCWGYGIPVYKEDEVKHIWESQRIKIDYYFSFYEAEYQLNKYTKQIQIN